MAPARSLTTAPQEDPGQGCVRGQAQGQGLGSLVAGLPWCGGSQLSILRGPLPQVSSRPAQASLWQGRGATCWDSMGSAAELAAGTGEWASESGDQEGALSRIPRLPSCPYRPDTETQRPAGPETWSLVFQGHVLTGRKGHISLLCPAPL